MAVNAQAARPRKCFAARLADIAILRLRKAGLAMMDVYNGGAKYWYRSRAGG